MTKTLVQIAIAAVTGTETVCLCTRCGLAAPLSFGLLVVVAGVVGFATTRDEVRHTEAPTVAKAAGTHPDL